MGVIAANLVVTVEYFVPDSHKDGGEYLFKSGVVEKISPAERVVMVAARFSVWTGSLESVASYSRESSERNDSIICHGLLLDFRCFRLKKLTILYSA